MIHSQTTPPPAGEVRQPKTSPATSVVDAMVAEWDRRPRKSRTVQIALRVHADSAESAAEELEYMAQKILDGQFTVGTDVGRTHNVAWCARFMPNTETREHPDYAEDEEENTEVSNSGANNNQP